MPECLGNANGAAEVEFALPGFRGRVENTYRRLRTVTADDLGGDVYEEEDGGVRGNVSGEQGTDKMGVFLVSAQLPNVLQV